jgi:hypothetical protein
VADTSVALLIVDGKFVKLLEPGLHVFWKFQRVLKDVVRIQVPAN